MKIYALAILLIFPTITLAGSQTGKVTGYVPYHNGTLKSFGFKLENNIIEGCNTTGRFHFDSEMVEFNQMVSSIIAAYHSNTEVKVNYSTTCNTLGNSFDTNYVCVGNINC